MASTQGQAIASGFMKMGVAGAFMGMFADPGPPVAYYEDYPWRKFSRKSGMQRSGGTARTNFGRRPRTKRPRKVFLKEFKEARTYKRAKSGPAGLYGGGQSKDTTRLLAHKIEGTQYFPLSSYVAKESASLFKPKNITSRARRVQRPAIQQPRVARPGGLF